MIMPNRQQPFRSEFDYLREQRTFARQEIQATLASLGAALREGADPRRLASAHPWATAGTAFGLGLTAGYVIVPKKTGMPAAASTGGPQSTAAPMTGAGTDASEAPVATGGSVDPSNGVGDKLAAGAKSLVVGAAYGLGRMALTQVLNGFLAGLHPPGDPGDPGSEYAATHQAESFQWQPETPT